MKFLAEVSEAGVTERRFDMEVDGACVPGILWTPTGASGPRPLLLQGHGGIQHKRIDNVLALARRMVGNHGWAVAAIDAPGHGDRVSKEEAERAREQMVRQVQSGKPLSDAQRNAMAASAKTAVAEWRATLDALQRLDEVGSAHPVAYWGVSMGTRFGVPLVASEPRIRCAVLGLFGIGAEADAFSEDARRIEVPLLFLFQLHDELMSTKSGIALFEAFGSKVKTMHINPGPHVAVPRFERDESEAFFLRHIPAEATAG